MTSFLNCYGWNIDCKTVWSSVVLVSSTCVSMFLIMYFIYSHLASSLHVAVMSIIFISSIAVSFLCTAVLTKCL